MQELEVLGFGTEAHHSLDTGAIVPTAVEEHDLSSGGQVGHVTLEVPLCFFALRGCGEGHHPAHAGVQTLGDSLDGATFAGGIASLEEGHDSQSPVAHPFLEFHQLHLKTAQLLVIVAIDSEPQLFLWS